MEIINALKKEAGQFRIGWENMCDFLSKGIVKSSYKKTGETFAKSKKEEGTKKGLEDYFSGTIEASRKIRLYQ